MAETYQIKLTKKEEVAQGTEAFYFEKPNGFSFKPGQTADLTLIDPSETDAEGNSRIFTIAAAPFETELMIATRMRDTAFKRALKNKAVGAKINMEGPFGSFTLHQDPSKTAAFLAGGIGITPFFSIIKQATFQKLPHKLDLFYSNRRPEDTAFFANLLALEKTNPNFKFIPTMTNMDKSNRLWPGETGYIEEKMIKKYIQDANQVIFYLAGPPTMVSAMRTMLEQANINPDNIRFEEFAGY